MHSVRSLPWLLGGALWMGTACRPQAPPPPPKAAQSAPTVAPSAEAAQAPTGAKPGGSATAPAGQPQRYPPVEGFKEAIEEAARSCLPHGHFERRCPAWRSLRESHRLHAGEPQWQQGVLDALSGPTGEAHVAIQLIDDGAIALNETQQVQVRGALQRWMRQADAPTPLRVAAARAYGGVLDDAGAVRWLFANVEDEVLPEELRQALVYLLGRPHAALVAVRKDVLRILKGVLKVPGHSLTAPALHSLGALRDEASLPLFLARLDDEQLASVAISGLTQLKDKRAYTALIERLEAAAAPEAPLPSVPLLWGALNLRVHPQYEVQRVLRVFAQLEAKWAPRVQESAAAFEVHRRIVQLHAQLQAEGGAKP